MKKSILIDIACVLLMVMFLYASFSKYFDYQAFERAMHNQPFPYWMSAALIWLLPPVEIWTAILLFFERTRIRGLWSSAILMSLFTGYILAALLHFFKRVPCSCGGIIKHLGWTGHLFFNLFFLALAIIALICHSYHPKNISRAKAG